MPRGACRPRCAAFEALASVPPTLPHRRTLPLPALRAVTERVSNTQIPPVDPAVPDPVNTVNVTVVSTPNARAQEMLVDLPLSYFLPPKATTPGRLPLILDLEQRRLEVDGLCSLVLRTPCVWEGVEYRAVGPVVPVPTLSALSANETDEAWALAGIPAPPPPPASTPAPAPGADLDAEAAAAADRAPAAGDGTFTGACRWRGLSCAVGGFCVLCCRDAADVQDANSRPPHPSAARISCRRQRRHGWRGSAGCVRVEVPCDWCP